MSYAPTTLERLDALANIATARAIGIVDDRKAMELLDRVTHQPIRIEGWREERETESRRDPCQPYSPR